MRRTLLFIACVLASVTMLAQEGLPVEDLQNSGCLARTRGEEYVEPIPTIVLTKEGSILSVQLLNYKSICGTVDFTVTSTVNGSSDGAPCAVNISVAPNLYPGGGFPGCLCPYNISFTVRDIETNTFYLNCWWYEGLVKLAEGQSYQATYGGSFYSYHPFLKEGKTWNYQEYYHNVWNDERWTKEVSYVINGTTEIDGKTYYKLYRISEDGNIYYCALREEDRKVWQYTSNEGDHLLYDFGMSVGDSYTPTFEPFLFQLTSIKPMRFHDDQLLNVFFYDMYDQYDPTESPISFAPVPIVEGVGCENGWNIVEFYAAQPTNGIIYGERFLSCYEDGKCIFMADDFNNLKKPKSDDLTYRPFVEDGKVWKVGTISGNPVQMVDYYYFDGDTIVNGKACKQMMCQRFVSPDYSNEYGMPTSSLSKVGVWYEEDKKVYCYDERKQAMALKYDFSIGDNESLQLIDDYPPFVIGPRQSGGIEGFKGIYRDVMTSQHTKSTTWLEGVGGIDGPTRNAYHEATDHLPEFLMSCAVGDEVIFLNDGVVDGATPTEARKSRFDFTHTIKTKPKAPRRLPADTDVHVYGEYNDQQLGINLDPLADTYQVSITGESGQVVYEKAVNAGTVVALNIDISAYAKGRYTVTIENSSESFVGQFESQTTGIQAPVKVPVPVTHIYNLQGQRLSSLQKGLNIINGQKVYVK